MPSRTGVALVRRTISCWRGSPKKKARSTIYKRGVDLLLYFLLMFKGDNTVCTAIIYRGWFYRIKVSAVKCLERGMVRRFEYLFIVQLWFWVGYIEVPN